MTVTVAFLYVGHEEAQMGRCLTRIWRGALTPLTLGLAAAFALVVAGAQDAGAQVFSNCTGAASVGPSISDGSLEIGQTASLSVVVQNTSFAPTMPTSTNVSSVVGGQTCNAGSCSISGDGCTVDADCETTLQLLLACGNNLCSTQLPGTLLFKAAAGNGCTSSLAAVDRCELDPADATGNTVNVVLKGGAANGIAFTPQQSQTIATFDVVAANPVLSNLAGSFFIIGLGDGLILRTNDALCVPDQFGTGSGTTTPTFPPVCAVKVDKQVACNGVDFVDAQLVTNNQDGTISCTGWNAFDNNPAEAVAVRYQGQNAGNLTLSSCTLMESNDQIPAGAPPFPTTIAGPSVDSVTFVLTPGDTTGFTTADTVCSETLVSNGREPNTATLACQCVTGAPVGTLNASALDTAQINCLAPDLNLTKKCVDTTIPPDGVDDAVEVTATNGGTASLSNCVVTDLLNRDDTDCSVGGGDPVSVSPNNFSLAALNGSQISTGTIPAPPLAQNACDSASVVCDVDGAGKQATADAPPVVCTGGVCAAEFDKQISCNGTDWVDVSIPVNGQNAGDIDDATNSQIIDCTSWNAYNDGSGTMPAEGASKRFVIDNTGTFNISCRVEDTVNGNTTVVVQTQEFAPGVHVIPLPDTCDADISGVDSAVLVCECPQGELMHDNPITDQAEIMCKSPDLTVSKICGQQAFGASPVTITVTNPAGADRATLQNCMVTDELADGTPVCSENIGSLQPGQSTEVDCSVPGLTDTVLNDVTVECEIVDANGKTIQRMDQATCGVPLGCRLTAGGITPDGGIDMTEFAQAQKITFGGQVGAPCGCIGCFDDLDHIQGEWTHSRHKRKGRFHASDYASLVCAFDGGACLDGVCVGSERAGESCKKNIDCAPPEGPEPRPAPANKACFTGVGRIARNGGPRTDVVVFRVEVEDRGEPGAGQNSGTMADVYKIRMWQPGVDVNGNDVPDETVDGLLADVCCQQADVNPDLRAPNINDGGDLTHGNIQIHPVTPLTARGICPPPGGTCAVGD
jgi:hypothetical protein